MDMKSEIEKEVQRTLESLDHIQQADPDPYFYSRLKARMEPSVQSGISLYWKLGFSLLVLFNLGSFWMLSESTSISSDDEINTLVEEYFDYTTNYNDLLSLEETGL